MKKIYQLFLLLICFMLLFSLVPQKSYGICNTVQLTKEVTAIKLTTSDGKVLFDVKVVRRNLGATPAVPANFKNLNLIFVVETENNVSFHKETLQNFVNQIYQLYQGYTDKIQIGIIPFQDLTQEQILNRTTTIQTDVDVLNSDQLTVLSAINGMNPNSQRTVLEAIETAEYNFVDNPGGILNSELLQCMVFITDGLPNSDITVPINGITKNLLSASNIILKDMSNNNMVSMYGILEETGSDQIFNKLFNGIYELILSENLTIANLGNQLFNSVYTYIRDYIVNTNTIMLSGVGNPRNVAFTPAQIMLTVDDEFMFGATLWVEYKITSSRYAAYGSGTIFSNRLTDESNLSFSQSERLLTDPSKTNADFGWYVLNDKLISDSLSPESYLVLSKVLTPDTFQNDPIFHNLVTANTSFDVGSGSIANYSLTAKAPDVLILPPFGPEEQQQEPVKPNTSSIIWGSISGISMISIIILIIRYKKYPSA